MWTLCGHLYDYGCVVKILQAAKPRYVVKGCKYPDQLNHYKDNDPGPAHFAQADQEQASYAIFQKMQEDREEEFRVQARQQLQIAAARQNSNELFLMQVKHLQTLLRNSYSGTQRRSISSQIAKAENGASVAAKEKNDA